MLGLYEEVQDRVREEVDQLMDCEGIDSAHLTVHDVKQLKYLECVLKEVQRIYPTAPFIGRELSEDTKISKRKRMSVVGSYFPLIDLQTDIWFQKAPQWESSPMFYIEIRKCIQIRKSFNQIVSCPRIAMADIRIRLFRSRLAHGIVLDKNLQLWSKKL